MYVIIGLLILVFFLSFWMGYRRLLRLKHLNQRRVINGFIGAMIVLTMMSIGQWTGLFSQDIAARFTMLLYCMVAGFFSGFAAKMIILKQETEATEYVCRSYWTEAPTLIAVLLIIFGIYRTGLFSFGPYTGIGITSGLSLLGFGFFGLTVKIVPEFRQRGILILDQVVPWKNVVSYKWESENVLQIDYYTHEKELTDFSTYIPTEDHLIIERLLGKKLKEHEEERKKMMEQVEG